MFDRAWKSLCYPTLRVKTAEGLGTTSKPNLKVRHPLRECFCIDRLCSKSTYV